MSDFQFQVGDKVRLEGTVTKILDGDLFVDDLYRGRSGFVLVERAKPKRPIRNGDQVRTFAGVGCYVGRRAEFAVVRIQGAWPLYDGYVAENVTHANGDEIDWENSQ